MLSRQGDVARKEKKRARWPGVRGKREKKAGARQGTRAQGAPIREEETSRPKGWTLGLAVSLAVGPRGQAWLLGLAARLGLLGLVLGLIFVPNGLKF